jgi:hypothetical protein
MMVVVVVGLRIPAQRRRRGICGGGVFPPPTLWPIIDDFGPPILARKQQLKMGEKAPRCWFTTLMRFILARVHSRLK